MTLRLSFQLLQGGSEQLLRSLHLHKDLSAYSYIGSGVQLKVRVLPTHEESLFLGPFELWHDQPYYGLCAAPAEFMHLCQFS